MVKLVNNQLLYKELTDRHLNSQRHSLKIEKKWTFKFFKELSLSTSKYNSQENDTDAITISCFVVLLLTTEQYTNHYNSVEIYEIH